MGVPSSGTLTFLFTDIERSTARWEWGRAAMAEALAAHDELLEAQEGLGLPVRMGVHTGYVEARGDDYFGPVLNRTARIMAAGHGGQILLSTATVALLEGVDVSDLGEHRLRVVASMWDDRDVFNIRLAIAHTVVICVRAARFRDAALLDGWLGPDAVPLPPNYAARLDEARSAIQLQLGEEAGELRSRSAGWPLAPLIEHTLTTLTSIAETDEPAPV